MIKSKSLDLDDQDVETRKIEELKEKLKKIKERELKLYSKIQKQSQQTYERIGNERKDSQPRASARTRPFSASGSLKSPLQRQSLGSSLFAVPRAKLPPSLQFTDDSETTPKKNRSPWIPGGALWQSSTPTLSWHRVPGKEGENSKKESLRQSIPKYFHDVQPGEAIVES
eukprot:749388-Hanusia_phi.AAC.4